MQKLAWIATALLVLTVLVYSAVGSFDFVNFDDPNYVYENQQVKQGLSLSGTKWAFTTGHSSNWHPLTWLSHMLDVEIFGLNSGAHHLVNLGLHVLNTLLLFGLLFKSTGAVWRSAMVAALFAVHPLHVESVAWISERKDVLSTLFFMLTLLAYVQYVRKRGLGRYGLVLVLMALGLMAKPMLVTLPFILLLLDLWPLKRVNFADWQMADAVRLAVEKIPFFILIFVSSVITFLVQREGGAVVSLEQTPLDLRLSNVLYSYVLYIGKMCWPTGMAVLYPYPESIPILKIVGSGLLMLCASACALMGLRRFTYLTVGWFWFVGMLVPVIGIVQVGGQSMADRYTYLPSIGLFLIVVWGGFELLGGKSAKKPPLILLCLSTIIALSVACWIQVQNWANSESLWNHTLSVTTGNFRAHHKLGVVLADRGNHDEAIQHFHAAVRLRPHFAYALNGLGNSLAAIGQAAEAVEYYRRSISYYPEYVAAHNGLGSALDDLGEVDQAVAAYRNALKWDSEYAPAHNNLAAAMAKQGKIDEAITEMKLALKFDQENAGYHFNYSMLVNFKGDQAQARQHLLMTLKLDPGHQQARQALSNLSEGKNDSG